MPKSEKTAVYLEVGSKRTFAGAVDWPGWSRNGKDEAAALQALADYGKRYAAALRPARLGFQPVRDASALRVVERLTGDTTTDFGAPGCIPKADERPVYDAELRRLQAILRACWKTFDALVETAAGRQLQTGPRGGGRDRIKIIEHVVGAEHAYLYKLGVKLPMHEEAPVEQRRDEYRKAALQGIVASAHGELPRQGPRGGLIWPARYFVRRTAWHVLDHAWEIEDRLE